MRRKPPPILSGLKNEEAFIVMTQLGYFGVAFAARYDGASVPHALTTIGSPLWIAHRRKERVVPSGHRRSVPSR